MNDEKIACEHNRRSAIHFLSETIKTGCSNHNCIITGPKNGQGTNSSCRCKRHIIQWLESLEEITRMEHR